MPRTDSVSSVEPQPYWLVPPWYGPPMAQHPMPSALVVMPLRPRVRLMSPTVVPGARSRSRWHPGVMPYTPAATAELSGFSLDTLRYYERIGLLYDIDRTPGGQRVFTDEDLGWLG